MKNKRKKFTNLPLRTIIEVLNIGSHMVAKSRFLGLSNRIATAITAAPATFVSNTKDHNKTTTPPTKVKT